MASVILVIHLILALGIIGLVLVQRSEGGLGLTGGGLGNFASARGTANALTRLTAIFAAGFFATSLTLAVLAGSQTKPTRGILESVEIQKNINDPADEEEDGVSAPIEGLKNEISPGITYTPPESMDFTPPDEISAPSEEEKANNDADSSAETKQTIDSNEKEGASKTKSEETKDSSTEGKVDKPSEEEKAKNLENKQSKKLEPATNPVKDSKQTKTGKSSPTD